MTTETTTPNTTYAHIRTFDLSGKETDCRVIDLSNNGARTWLLNHQWWALNNGYMLGVTVATKDEYDRYQLGRLASKYNNKGAA